MKRLITILSVLLLWTVVCGPWTASAAVPHLIAYQGRLTDSAGIPLDGSYSITFRIYNAEAAGNLLWQETHSNTTVTDGIFDVLLGSVTTLDLPFDIQYYLAIQVAGDPEMTPRQQLASAGYAFKAEKAEQADNATTATNATNATNADTVDGIHASANVEANKLLALNAGSKFPVAALGLNTVYITWGPADGLIKGILTVTEAGGGNYYVMRDGFEIRIIAPVHSIGVHSGTVTWSELTVYYGNVNGSNYINDVYIFETDLDGTTTEKVHHIDDLTSGTSHQIIDTPFVADVGKAYYLYITTAGGALLYTFKAKFTIAD